MYSIFYINFCRHNLPIQIKGKQLFSCTHIFLDAILQMPHKFPIFIVDILKGCLTRIMIQILSPMSHCVHLCALFLKSNSLKKLGSVYNDSLDHSAIQETSCSSSIMKFAFAAPSSPTTNDNITQNKVEIQGI